MPMLKLQSELFECQNFMSNFGTSLRVHWFQSEDLRFVAILTRFKYRGMLDEIVELTHNFKIILSNHKVIPLRLFKKKLHKSCQFLIKTVIIKCQVNFVFNLMIFFVMKLN